MPLTHKGHEAVTDFVDDAEGRGAVGGAAAQRTGAIAEAVVATTNAGDFDAREAAKKALANSQR